MARTIAEIKATMSASYIANETIIAMYELDVNKTFEEQFSKVSIENILFYVVAASVWILETFFDSHKMEVLEIIKTMRPHTEEWYRNTSFEFQYGYELSDLTGEYDNVNLTADEIALSRIITKCSVSRTTSIKPTLQVKVATDNGALSSLQKTAFESYMNKRADAGVHIVVVTGNPDRLALWLRIFYNPMVMDSSGTTIIGGLKPVESAVKNHLKNLKFNGNYANTYLIDELQLIDGIKLPVVLHVEAAPQGNTLTQFTEVYYPYSGALDIDITNDLHITYEPMV